MAKKKASKKPTRARKATKRGIKASGDTSRLDTGPLQEHIRKRIKDLEGKAAARSGAARQEDDGTLERLKQALETLEDICFPSMTIPI